MTEQPTPTLFIDKSPYYVKRKHVLQWQCHGHNLSTDGVWCTKNLMIDPVVDILYLDEGTRCIGVLEDGDIDGNLLKADYCIFKLSRYYFPPFLLSFFWCSRTACSVLLNQDQSGWFRSFVWIFWIVRHPPHRHPPHQTSTTPKPKKDIHHTRHPPH